MEKPEINRENDFVCKFCNRGFKSVKTLGAHTCEQKRRHLSQNEKYVQLGFRAFQRFHDLNGDPLTYKAKSFEEFRRSQFYLGFTKFGKFSYDVNVLDYTEFVDFLIRNSVRLDDWCKDEAYTLFVKDYILREAASDAVERSITFMQKWAEQKNDQWCNFYRNSTTNIMVYYITTGRVSPWAIFNCDSGVTSLDMFTNEQLQMISDFVDPMVWSRKIRENNDDVVFIRDLLIGAGL